MKRLLILLLFLISYGQTDACDVCGCKLGGLYFGVLPQFEGHYLGLRYSHAVFNASILYNSDYVDDEFSEDTYQRMELMGKYAISSRWQVNVIIPYMMNQMNGSHQDVNSSGPGDPMVLAYYKVLNTGNSLGVEHALLAGGGIKLPFGDYNKTDNGEIINRNFQLGSGSLDYITSLNYTIRLNAVGLNVESSYKINTANDDDYRFGNQLNVSSYLFYWIDKSSFSLLPFAGAFYEQAERHKDGKVEALNSGGNALFATAGLQFYKGAFSFNTQYQIPVTQSYNSENIASIEAGNRLTLGVVYNFTGKK